MDDAAAACEEVSRWAEKRNAAIDIAFNELDLGTLRMRQQCYAEALTANHGARERVETLGTPGSVAIDWHQIGMVHREAGQFDQAERAHRQALTIWVQQNERAGEAASLLELGCLYGDMGRMEHAASCAGPTSARNPTATPLHPGRPGPSSDNLETTAGNPQAAAEARWEAMRLFLAYRRDGGENHDTGAKLRALVGEVFWRWTPPRRPACSTNWPGKRICRTSTRR